MLDDMANNKERFSQVEIADTGETRLHFLAREGKVEILESYLKDERITEVLVRGLLFPDKLNWHPVMSATKADSGARDMIENLIGFLKEHIKKQSEVEDLIDTKNKNQDTLFTLLMRTGLDYEDFAGARKDLFRLIKKHSNIDLWFIKLVKQLLEPNSCDLNSRSMKEIIDLAAQNEVDFGAILEQKDPAGNNILMELARNMKDDALREFLTNTNSSCCVSFFFLFDLLHDMFALCIIHEVKFHVLFMGKFWKKTFMLYSICTQTPCMDKMARKPLPILP